MPVREERSVQRAATAHVLQTQRSTELRLTNRSQGVAAEPRRCVHDVAERLPGGMLQEVQLLVRSCCLPIERSRDRLDAKSFRLYLRREQLLPWRRLLQQLTQALAALQHGCGHSDVELAGNELALSATDGAGLLEDNVMLARAWRARRQRR